MKLTDRKVTTLAAVSAVFMLGLIIYLGNAIRSVETLEERLRYREPSLDLASGKSEQVNDMRRTYVPVYSHIYGSGGKPFPLGATLSIRNTGFASTLEVIKIDYYNTEGQLIKSFIDAPRMLPAMATATFLVDKLDVQGGDGANFVITWRGSSDGTEPLMEAVMVGSEDGKQISFTTRGERILPFQQDE